jgi:putative NIF3 family GTP cyclohydrolase 1 type 2
MDNMKKVRLVNVNNSGNERGLMPRRKFLGTVASVAGIASLSTVALPGLSMHFNGASSLNVKEIIDMILAKIPGAPFKQTVDTLKAGRMDQTVRGIVTCMFPTIDVIQKCAELQANFIIVHEPTFYNHLDDTQWLEDDEVYKFKAGLLKKHDIAVWRFHDYWHAHRPDGILMGVLTALGWDQYYDPGNPGIITVPPLTLDELVKHAKQKMGIAETKVVGDPAQVCKRIAIMPGAAGGRSQIQVLKNEQPDALLVGEVNEWETAEYVRDARAMGKSLSLVVLGHAVSEEPGMAWLVNWLQPMTRDIKVTHVPSGDPYTNEIS